MTEARPPAVLIVERDASMRAFLRDLLEANGWTVTETTSRAAAMDAAQALAASGALLAVVVGDGLLPGGDVFAFLPVLKSAARGALVVVLTSYLDDDAAERGEKAGARATLVKPFDVDELLGLVDEAR